MEKASERKCYILFFIVFIDPAFLINYSGRRFKQKQTKHFLLTVRGFSLPFTKVFTVFLFFSDQLYKVYRFCFPDISFPTCLK